MFTLTISTWPFIKPSSAHYKYALVSSTVFLLGALSFVRLNCDRFCGSRTLDSAREPTESARAHFLCLTNSSNIRATEHQDKSLFVGEHSNGDKVFVSDGIHMDQLFLGESSSVRINICYIVFKNSSYFQCCSFSSANRHVINYENQAFTAAWKYTYDYEVRSEPFQISDVLRDKGFHLTQFVAFNSIFSHSVHGTLPNDSNQTTQLKLRVSTVFSCESGEVPDPYPEVHISVVLIGPDGIQSEENFHWYL